MNPAEINSTENTIPSPLSADSTLPERLETYSVEVIAKLSYEQTSYCLETVLSEMEQHDLPLERAMLLFEVGTRLSQHCQAILAQTEQKIQGLTQGE